MISLLVFKSVSFSQYVPGNGPSRSIVLQTNQLIAVKPNMTGKVTFCVGYLPGMWRNSWHKRFTKCFVLGYKNGFDQTKDHSLCNNEHWNCKQMKIVKGKLFILMQFVILLFCASWNIFFVMGLYPQIIAMYSFPVNPFLNLTTQFD